MIVNGKVVLLILFVLIVLITKVCVKFVDSVSLKSSILVTIYMFLLFLIFLFIHIMIKSEIDTKELIGVNTYQVKNVKERVVSTIGFSITRDNCEEIIVEDLDYPILEEKIYVVYKKCLFFYIEQYKNKYVLKIPKDFNGT